MELPLVPTDDAPLMAASNPFASSTFDAGELLPVVHLDHDPDQHLGGAAGDGVSGDGRLMVGVGKHGKGECAHVFRV
jgi:hypothetical protein